MGVRRQVGRTGARLVLAAVLAAGTLVATATAPQEAVGSREGSQSGALTCREALARARENLATARRLEARAAAGAIGIVEVRGVPVLVDVQTRRGQIEIVRIAGAETRSEAELNAIIDKAARPMVLRAQRLFFALRTRFQATVARLGKRCGAAPTPTPTPKPVPKPPPAAGAFTLVEPVKVDPPLPQREFDQFDAKGGIATWVHCCDGGKWAIRYTFKVPQSVSPGNSYPIELGMDVMSYESGGPSAFQITARADGIQDADPALRITVNGATSGSKTLTLFVPASAKDAKELFVTVTFARFTVIYTFRRAGA